MLRIEHLRIGGLPEINISAAEGTCLSVEGPSGSGKTRLLRAIADLEPARGYVFFNGAERREMSAPEWRRQVRYISAEPGWWTDTARQAIKDQCAADTTRTDKVERLCESFGLAPDLLDRPLDVVSTGERHRLAVAIAMSDDPPVLLLDEPTGSLDATNTALIEEHLRYLLLSQHTIVLVSHDLNQIKRLSDQRLQLGPPEPNPSTAASDMGNNGAPASGPNGTPDHLSGRP